MRRHPNSLGEAARWKVTVEHSSTVLPQCPDFPTHEHVVIFEHPIFERFARKLARARVENCEHGSDFDTRRVVRKEKV